MMNDFNKFPNFRFWTQRVLPCVFDESLSYVEKINKLEQMINDLIDEYNKFGQQVTNEVNTFETETNQKIQDFINQVTQIINDFKQQVTTEITNFEKQVTDSQNEYEKSMNALYAQFTQSINSTIEEFENRVTEQQNLFMTQVNNRINTMQAVVDDIPETVANTVNEVAIPWLNANVPDMVETQVAQDVCKVYDLDNATIASTFNNDANNMTNTGVYLLVSSISNIPSSAVFPAYLFTSNLGGDGQTVSQYIIDSASGIWKRERIGGTWNAWSVMNRNNFQIQRLVADTSSNNLTNTGIYYTDSNSGVTVSDLPNTKLEYGSIYIQTITNPDPMTVQYLYNTGDYGASIYSRQKNGSSWGTWKAIAPNVRYEETTTFTLAGATPSYESYYPTSISTIGLPDENIFDGFEVQAIVNIDDKSSTPTPMLYNANLVYNASSPNVITIGFKVFDYESQAGKFYVKFRVLDWR